MPNSTNIIRQDSKGRTRSTAQQRAGLLEEFNRSGLSAKRFAELAGVRYHTFWTWLNRSRSTGGEGSTCTPVSQTPPRPAINFIELLPDTRSNGLQVQLPGGAIILVKGATDLSLAAQLLQVLKEGSRC